jgi:galactonate dehydratase
MQIAYIDCLSAAAGWRIHDFLKVTMVDGLVGWSEFSRAFKGPGAHEAIAAIAPALIGKDPRSAAVQTLLLESARRSSISQQAAAAVHNALLDVRARALGVPVYELLGGLLRDRIPVYWAHCGTYRVSHADLMERPALRSLDDVVELGREVTARGYAALKTNLLLFDGSAGRRYAPRTTEQAPTLTATPALMRALSEQLAAFRAGAGADTEIMVDLGSNFRTEGAVRMARAMEDVRPAWVEVELHNAAALQHLRKRTSVPVAAGESLRPREYYDLLQAGGVDVMIVDVLFNGLLPALHVAAACAAHDINVAVHNCYSPLATAIAAAFCAVVPNLQILEYDVDEVPWSASFVTHPPEIHDGILSVPTGPGWGTAVNEAAVREHPVPLREA